MKITVKESGKLDDILYATLKTASKTRIKKMIAYHAITVNGARCNNGSRMLAPGMVIEISQAQSKQTRKPPFHIHFEDRSLLVAEKPAGVLSEKQKNGDDSFQTLVENYASRKTDGRQKIYLVHRLDFAASGLMLFAKNAHVQALLQKNWEDVEKKYYALLEKPLPKKEVVMHTYIREDEPFRVVSYNKPVEGAREAITIFRMLSEKKGSNLVEAELKTGRKHQIRVHAHDMNCPIVGDQRYGASREQEAIMLHAYSLSFRHPITKKPIHIAIEMPRRFKMERKKG